MNITDARIAKGWSQQQLAGAAGLSLGTVSAAERYGRVSAESTRKMAKALGIPIDTLKHRALRTSPALSMAEKINDLERRVAALEEMLARGTGGET